MKKIETIALEVKKREYFCIVKHLKNIFRTILFQVIILIISSFTTASAQNNKACNTDSVIVSLLTCAPHNEIYSLYGHTALRYQDIRTGEDLAFSYGVFNFKKPFFILRFTLGITDYELGVIPFNIFLREYQKYGSKVTEQVLNITQEEKAKLYNALKTNYLPGNRIYRYNFFYDNCTTRARDMIESCINGKIVYASQGLSETYREMVHFYTKAHPWAEFGNDLCLGLKADIKTSQRERQFLPENLMRDFESAKIYHNGNYRPLVKEQNVLTAQNTVAQEKTFPLEPIQCACILFIASILITCIEHIKKTIYKGWDLVLYMTTSTAGIITFALLFSEHPTTSSNLQILILNPVPFLFIKQIAKSGDTLFWKVQAALIILFFMGSFFQDYAEGMEFVALSLLTRCWTHLYAGYRIRQKQYR